MVKDIFTVLGIDTMLGFIIWATDPTFLKIVLGIGIATLFALLFLSKQGRVSIYGANLVMVFTAVMHYL